MKLFLTALYNFSLGVVMRRAKRCDSTVCHCQLYINTSAEVYTDDYIWVLSFHKVTKKGYQFCQRNDDSDLQIGCIRNVHATCLGDLESAPKNTQNLHMETEKVLRICEKQHFCMKNLNCNYENCIGKITWCYWLLHTTSKS